MQSRIGQHNPEYYFYPIQKLYVNTILTEVHKMRFFIIFDRMSFQLHRNKKDLILLLIYLVN